MKPGPKPGSPAYRAPQPLDERIRSRVRIDESGCWLYLGNTNGKGYGLMTVGSRIDGTYKTASVHRLSYEVFVGPIPDGLTLDHLCEVKHCCNPEHLEPVTNAENSKRRGDRMEKCRRGHPRTPENFYLNSAGRRQCRPCVRIARAARRQRRQEAAA